jgi:hypothetical protein
VAAVTGDALAQIAQGDDGGRRLKLTETVFHSPVDEQCHLMAFHPYAPQLVLANQDTGVVSVWHTDRLALAARLPAKRHVGAKHRLTAVKCEGGGGRGWGAHGR